MWSGTVASASNYVAHLSKDVEDARRELIAPKNARPRTGPSTAPARVIRTGAADTNTEKRTLTGKSFQLKTKV